MFTSLPHVLCTLEVDSVMERVFKKGQNTNGYGSLSLQSLLVLKTPSKKKLRKVEKHLKPEKKTLFLTHEFVRMAMMGGTFLICFQFPL